MSPASPGMRSEVSLHPFGTALESRNVDAAAALLADDVMFRSPIVFKPYRGRRAVAIILHAIVQVLDDFRYVRAIGAPDDADHALVFEALLGELHIEGCDFLHIQRDGLVAELTVMVRPLSAALALTDAMNAQLTAALPEHAGSI